MADAQQERADRLVASLTNRAELAISLRDKRGRKLASDLLADLRKADRDLGRRLHAVADATGGIDSTFEAVQMAAYRQQIQIAMDYVKRRLRRYTRNGARAATQMALEDGVTMLEGLDRIYSGIRTPPLLAEAQVLRSVEGQVMGSLLSQHETSVNRYGVAMIGTFEANLRQGLLTGASQRRMVAQLVSAQQPDLDPDIILRTGTGKGGLLLRNEYWAHRIVRTECLPGETRVDAAVVRAVHRRWHEGPIIEVRTAAGRYFRATPNHPMLTKRGWVGAGFLRYDDDLIRDSGKQDSGSPSNQHVDSPPATIAEVFDAASHIGVAERRRGGHDDFHGDGADGDVDVQVIDGVLRVGRFSPLTKPLAHLLFPEADLAGSAFCEGCGHLFTNEGRCLCPSAHAAPGAEYGAPDDGIADAEALRDVRDGGALGVGARDLNAGNIGTESGVPEGLESVASGGTLRAQRNASALQGAGNGGAREAQALSDAPGTHSGQVEFDRVIHVERRSFAGHVYNLTCEHGYFALNEAYTGNTAYAYNRARLVGLQTEYASGDRGLRKKILAHFDSRTAPDSIAVHGQIRKLDGLFQDGAGRQYLQPPARPNDRETVIPWRMSWSESEHTKPQPAATVAKAIGDAVPEAEPLDKAAARAWQAAQRAAGDG